MYSSKITIYFKWLQHQGRNYVVFADNVACIVAVVAWRPVQTKSA